MKRLLSTSINHRYLDCVLLAIRISIACFMLGHGLGKLEKLFGSEPIKFADPIGLGEVTSLALTVFAEVGCSILVLLGLWTRLAVLPLMVVMLVAVFIIHLPKGFGEMEFALLYLLIYLFLFVTGSGKYSMDKWMENRNAK